jgi:hypothetical protein
MDAGSGLGRKAVSQFAGKTMYSMAENGKKQKLTTAKAAANRSADFANSKIP